MFARPSLLHGACRCAAGRRRAFDQAPPDAPLPVIEQRLSLGRAATRPDARATQLMLRKQLVGVSMACHGGMAEGDAVLGAPRVACKPARYVAAQLAAYQAGTHGAVPNDRPGQHMHQVANGAAGSAEEAEPASRYVNSLACLGC